MATLSSVDVNEELASFLCGDTPQRNPIGVPTVQVTILHAVASGLASYALRLSIIHGEGPALQVVLELYDPACGLMR